jgi:hypothetical protein
MKLIEALARQLDAKLDWSSSKGTALNLEFSRHWRRSGHAMQARQKVGPGWSSRWKVLLQFAYIAEPQGDVTARPS